MVDHLKDIKATISEKLLGKKICLCLSGSIAAIKSVILARQLMRHGAEVYPVMTKAAREIIHPYAMEWATGNQVIVDITGKVEHVNLAGLSDNKVDLVLLAPATANTIGKIASGIDDTPVTTVITTALGSKIPLIIVPGMHEPMFHNPFISKNLDLLESTDGIQIIRPVIEENKAKMAGVDEIVDHVIRTLSDHCLEGKKILISTGPTREYLDSVRFISNPSSGKTGEELAKEAWYRGAEVEVIKGPVNIDINRNIKVSAITSTAELLEVVEDRIKNWRPDSVIMASAVSDFTPEKTSEVKIKSGSRMTVELSPTPKIINTVKKMDDKIALIGYKAETGLSDEALVESAREKMKECSAEFIVANRVSREKIGFAADDNEVVIVHPDSERKMAGTKAQLAEKVMDELVKIFNSK
ncbi:MAG: bifunctional phosphopantothenoylcysteine decarboxylase/phosphopantothenate--cysteine ligase CoaBC [Candidatus Hodarchaeales archaeon]